MLLGSTVMRKLSLDRAAGTYGRWFNRISYHVHVYPPEVWRAELAKVGLQVVEQSYYFSAKAHQQAFDASHYLSVPNLVTRKLTGRWVLHPIQARPYDRWLRKYYEEPLPQTTGAYNSSLCEALMSRRWFWALLAGIAVFGFVLRVWNLDFDQRQHLNPDERYWALTSAELDRAEPVSGYPTPVGPVLDWLDADRSPANPYRVVTSFNYGPLPLAMLAGHRGVAAGRRGDGHPAPRMQSPTRSMRSVCRCSTAGRATVR